MLRSGLIPASLIPPKAIRELRELKRTRRKLVGMMASEKNRIQKVLEDANIKLASVVSKIDGFSYMNMIRVLMKKDKLSREEISDMALGKLKNKVDPLVEALNGKVTDNHRFLLRLHLNNITFLAERVQEIDEKIPKAMIPFQEENTLVQTILGISQTTSSAIIAEIRLYGNQSFRLGQTMMSFSYQKVNPSLVPDQLF